MYWSHMKLFWNCILPSSSLAHTADFRYVELRSNTGFLTRLLGLKLRKWAFTNFLLTFLKDLVCNVMGDFRLEDQLGVVLRMMPNIQWHNFVFLNFIFSMNQTQTLKHLRAFLLFLI